MGLLEENGLSVEILEGLSYRSTLEKSLKNNLNEFDRDALLEDAFAATEWLDRNPLLNKVALDYRIKSSESIRSKYERYYPDRPVNKTFNDLLGFRSFCFSYEEALTLAVPKIKIVDMSRGKAQDDGYRGVHLYYKRDNFHYPIEIQLSTMRDRQLNDWLHDYVYKKSYPLSVGRKMRALYEQGEFFDVHTFEEVLENVLSGCKG